MQERELIEKEFAAVLRVLGHPDRIRIVEELSGQEKDVKTLHVGLELPGPRVSQHLRLLRAYRIVDERREGRQRYYRLVQPQLPNWIRRGQDFVDSRLAVSPRPVLSDSL